MISSDGEKVEEEEDLEIHKEQENHKVKPIIKLDNLNIPMELSNFLLNPNIPT